MSHHSPLRALPRRPFYAMVAAAACAVGLSLAASPAASAAPAGAVSPAHWGRGTVRVVASGLDNPRGLAFVRGHL